ncbi:MAG: hypothetical protein R2778_02835 [Saprospiraceae bacterium]
MPSFLCIASYFKGNDFLRSLKACGATVYLVTSQKHSDKAWAKEALDDIFYIQQDEENEWNMEEAATGLAWLMRSKRIDRIVATPNRRCGRRALREDFRIPGMGQTRPGIFVINWPCALKQGMPASVPGFSSLFNDDMVNKFIQEFPGPWIISRRTSPHRYEKVYSGEELWEHVHTLGDKRHHFLVEQFKPGDVFHVDSLTVDGEFSAVMSCIFGLRPLR